MTYTCEITTQPAQPTLSIRTRAAVQDLPAAMGRCFGAIVAYLGSLGQQPVGPAYAAYFNMDMSDLDVEIGFGVASPLPGQASLRSHLPLAGAAREADLICPLSAFGHHLRRPTEESQRVPTSHEQG